VTDCVCIRRFYCLYGDSMNVAARMSANAKESGVCVSPSIAAHLASAPAHTDTHTDTDTDTDTDNCRVPGSLLRTLSERLGIPSEWIGSDSALPAAHAGSAGHTDVPSEELERASMRVAEHETASDARVETLQTPLDPSRRGTSVTSACATPRLCVVWRGVHVMSCRLM
jgi:hypothetical protein